MIHTFSQDLAQVDRDTPAEKVDQNERAAGGSALAIVGGDAGAALPPCCCGDAGSDGSTFAVAIGLDDAGLDGAFPT